MITQGGISKSLLYFQGNQPIFSPLVALTDISFIYPPGAAEGGCRSPNALFRFVFGCLLFFFSIYSYYLLETIL